jgi:hypothetical protein
MTIPVFTKSVGKIIPIVGGVASGGLTFAFFKPMSIKLKKYLTTLPMANVDFYKEVQDDNTVIEVDFTDIDLSDDKN